MKSNQVPQEISALIEYAEEEMEAQVSKAKEKSLQEETERVAAQRKETEEFYAKVEQYVPDAIRPFVNLGVWVNDTSEYGGSSRYKSWKKYLRFDIPDLAPIVMVFDFDTDKEPRHIAWIVAGVMEGWFGEDGEYINGQYSFGNHYASERDVDETEFRFVLAAASKSAGMMKAEKQIEPHRIRKYMELNDERKERLARERSEEQALFYAIKNDPIALNLLKAFVLLRDERSQFEEQMQAADEQLYSVENRWSRKAEELRRQADNAQRIADDERYRLESDLRDAESKLKKVERGW